MKILEGFFLFRNNFPLLAEYSHLSNAVSSSSVIVSMPAIGGGVLLQTEIVLRLKRSTSFKISVVEIVLFLCLVDEDILGLAGRPELAELDESILP